MRSFSIILLIFGCTQQSIQVDRSEVAFRLWTRSLQNYVLLTYGQLQGAPIIPNQPFKFVIHGYTDNADVEWMISTKDEYLKKDNFNVVLVDWRVPASDPVYPTSAANTRDVGKYVGELLIDLNQTFGVPYENYHLVGHSLGAHVSGFAGQTTKSEVGMSFGRITGMDPAGPAFFPSDADDRLSKDDAQYVDIIHTDMTKAGYPGNIGHADFYPHGGINPQAGCLEQPDTPLNWISCSHCRAYKFFAESINSYGFVANQCSSYAAYVLSQCLNNPSTLMGENVQIGTKGTFYLNTNEVSPYAKNGVL